MPPRPSRAGSPGRRTMTLPPAGGTSATLGAALLDDSTSPVLEAVHLRKQFALPRLNPLAPQRAVHAVEDTSLALYPARATALVGESGSGKTTVARMLARLHPPSAGAIRYAGQPVTAASGAALHAYRRHVQLIFQDPFSSLNPVHSVRYILSRPLTIFGDGHSRVGMRERILTLLERVSLTPAEQFIEKYPHELSGGQRQRIAIARALAARPSVLLADEPVSMLDVSIRLDILNLLARLKEEDRLALLYITHDIASARYFTDETAVMYAGQMVEGGPSEAVIQTPKHPYTQLLLSAAPDPDRMSGAGTDDADGSAGTDGAGGSRQRVVALPARGEIPSLLHPPSGCRFHPRCPHAMPVCSQRFPGRTELGGGHWTNCFLYGDGGGDRPPVAAQLSMTDSEMSS
jgi:peptide/nickel transport system ATP-binding protein